jgi:upstream activation factor subunit UAF30
MPAKKSTAPKTPAKKTSGKKSAAKTVAAAAPAPEPEVVAAPVAPDTVSTTTAEAPVEVSLLEQIESDFASLNERLAQFKTMYSSITTDLRKLQKNMARHVKENSRRNRKRKVPAGDRPKRAPSGFAKPALISKELCSFLGKPTGTEMARTEVTKYLTSYIKEHNLQDQANKRKIIPDAALKKLLNVKASDELTYFNLQKYMKVHFPKPASAIAAEAAAAAAAAATASA